MPAARSIRCRCYRLRTAFGDVVELLVDLPKFDLRRGQRGIVVTSFDEPCEAYDLEMEDKSGTFTGFAYSITPEEFNNLSRDAFVRAMEAVEKVDLVTAERELKKAIDLRPDLYIGGFVKSVLMSFDERVEVTGIGDDVSFCDSAASYGSSCRPDV